MNLEGKKTAPAQIFQVVVKAVCQFWARKEFVVFERKGIRLRRFRNSCPQDRASSRWAGANAFCCKQKEMVDQKTLKCLYESLKWNL